MPNAIKYSSSAQTLALKKGNYWIGTGDVGKGPTSTTDYYNGITPPSGGYTIYLNKASGGPSIYTAANDSQLISLSNTIAGQTFATAAAALAWFATQTDKMVFNRDYESIVTDSLTFNVDAGFTPSYPTTGTTWYDVSNSGNGTLINGLSFSSNNGGSLLFDGTDDYVNFGNILNPSLLNNNFTIEVWFNANNYFGGSQSRLVSYHDWYTFMFEGTNLKIEIRTNDLVYKSVGTSLPTLNTWNQLVAIYNGSQLKIYKNGVLSNSKNTTGNIGTTNYIFNIGAFQNQIAYRISGTMSSVRVYTKELSAAEVLQNYNATKGRFGL